MIEAIEKFLEKYVAKGYYKFIAKNKGTYIMDEDWDNLVILDGCRFDAFKNVNDITGELQYRYSRGSSTPGFLKHNFKESKWLDTVYVTANPLVNYHIGDSFHRVIPVWKDDWCEEYNTVLPKVMTKRTIKAYNNYPKKRLITHFVQPHYPFIGKTGREKIGDHDGLLSRNLFVKEKSTEHTDQLIWNLLKQGEVNKSTVWNAYLENLEIVLNEVKNLLPELKGKTVITSDHSNLFGEWLFPLPLKSYGHPGGIYHPKLIKVPWLVIEGEERKNIRVGEKSREKQKLKEAIGNLKI